MNTLALVQPGREDFVPAVQAQETYWVLTSDITTTLGWEIKPEGLCKGDVCIPLPNAPDLVDGDTLNLTRLAELIGRPLAVSIEDQAAYLGQPLERLAATVGQLDAPDFTLPDLDGKMHSLSDHRGSKLLLAAWASW